MKDIIVKLNGLGKIYINYIISIITLIILVFLLYPPLLLLLFVPKIIFNYQLFTLILILTILIFIVLINFLRSQWKDSNLIAVLGLFFTILFYISDMSQKDLLNIKILTSVGSYNCTVAQGILKDKDSIFSISYAYYNTDLNLQNIGFINQKYGPRAEIVFGQMTYNMIYSNRLLDSIVDLNIPTNSPVENMKFIQLMKNQVILFAQEIVQTMGCKSI